MSWIVEILVSNQTPYNCPFEIKKGQVLENKKIGTGLQNVAVVRDYFFKIPANSRQTLEIEVLCINELLSPPSGRLNLTNLQVTGDFSSQVDLWNIMNTNNDKI